MALRFYVGESDFRIPDVSGLLAQVDVRRPSLDCRVVEFSASLPSTLKVGYVVGPEKNKFLHKTYYQTYVPGDAARARKRGMGWNLKYDRTLATGLGRVSVYKNLMQRIGDAGLPHAMCRRAWSHSVRDKRRGHECQAPSVAMSAGLML
jgi:asparagine synthase (glutamine-hydrolysing)